MRHDVKYQIPTPTFVVGYVLFCMFYQRWHLVDSILPACFINRVNNMFNSLVEKTRKVEKKIGIELEKKEKTEFDKLLHFL